jgi:hypothetical protein
MAVLAASSVPMAQAAEPSRQGDSAGARESDRPEPKETGISVAVSVLRREVTDQRRRQPEGWPRSEANFAQDKNWTVPDEQVLRALQRRVHPNPAIDGYIKWQLLSFEPEMSELDENAARRIIASMPKLMSPP